MSPSRKRARPAESQEAPAENQADCPFTVEFPESNERLNKAKKQRNGSEDRPTPQPKYPLQVSPFAPLAKFRDPKNNMDRHYKVQPQQRWLDMTRYNSFVYNGSKHYSEGFVFVANDSTIERQKNPGDSLKPRKKSEDDWVARILEIRASDEHHVYARVYWMYWPDELPAGTRMGESSKRIKGRQPYHGANELIASNHMDIINVVSVTGSATVNWWDESNDEDLQAALYWRQAYDVRAAEISAAEPRCRCGLPENPDKSLIGCHNNSCDIQWLHDDCIIHEALLRTFKRLGTDKPYNPAPIKDKIDEDAGKEPLSPKESGGAQTALASIDVKSDAQTSERASSVIKAESLDNPTPEGKRSGRRQSDLQKTPKTPKAGPKAKPYEGLFSAQVINIESESPTQLEITDLRENVQGGDKLWTEPVACLKCETEIR